MQFTRQEKMAADRLAKAFGYSVQVDGDALVVQGQFRLSKLDTGQFRADQPDRELTGAPRQQLSDAILDVHFCIRSDARSAVVEKAEKAEPARREIVTVRDAVEALVHEFNIEDMVYHVRDRAAQGRVSDNVNTWDLPPVRRFAACVEKLKELLRA